MKYGPPLFLGILAVAVHVAIYVSGLSVPTGSLHDPDAYMRLIRAEELVKTGDWFNQMIERDNAPFGLEMHWSRPMDIALVVLAAPLTFFYDWKQSLFASGVIISPLLLIPALLFIDRLARRYLDFEGRLLALLFFLCQPGILNYFVAGRPDHHSLILLVVVAAWSLGALTINQSAPSGRLAALGWLCALGHWISIEFLVAYAVLSGALAIKWVFEPDSGRAIAGFQTHHLLGCFLFLVAETPEGLWGQWWLDRLSGFHCLVFFSITVAWWAMVQCNPATPTKRCGVGFLAAATATLFIIFFFPEMAKGPFGQVNPELKQVWLNHVQELHSLGHDGKSLTIGILSWLPAILPGLAWIAYSAISKVKREAWITPLGLSWILATIGLTCLAFLQKRWVSYADLLWIAPAVLAVRKWLEFCESRQWFRPIRAATLIFVCAGPLLLANWMDMEPTAVDKTSSESATDDRPEPNQTAPFRQVLSRLSVPNPDEALILLNFIDDGPEILYLSDHSTISSPYHRNDRGILDAHTVLSSPLDQKTIEILEKRKVDFLLVSKRESEEGFYGDAEQSLYYQLVNKTPPPGFSLEARGRKRDGATVYFYRYESEPSFHQQ